MINPREILDGYRETLEKIDAILARQDLPDYQRKGYERIREDSVWMISHICEDDNDYGVKYL